MKNFVLFAAALIVLGISNAEAQKKVRLQGVWKLTYQKFEYPDTTFVTTDFTNPQFKTYTAKHFSLSVLGDDGQFFGLFGMYSITPESYTEHIKYSSYKPFMGQSITFDSKFERDKWTISGPIEIEGRTSNLLEVWQRVE